MRLQKAIMVTPHPLTVLTHTPPDAVKALAEQILAEIGTVTVLKNRSGLVMLPATDSAQGTVFHLGEVLVAEAQLRLDDHDGAQGYGMVLGRDLAFAMAVAVLDAALTVNVQADAIRAFIDQQSQVQAQSDDALLRQVRATRIDDMETF